MLYTAKTLFRSLLLAFGRVLGFCMFRMTIQGQENLPPHKLRPLLLISNHFSWFDAAILAIYLPYQPAFIIATESLRLRWYAVFIRLFDSIPIWRGQVDRKALATAQEYLRCDIVVGLFPEGGMNPDIAERVARGEQIHEVRAHASRRSGQLARGRSGSALLATSSEAYILPVVLYGTEFILDNLPNFRRTDITMRIGPVFGPLTIDPSLRGPARRARLDELTDEMMRRLAALMPPERRGPYADPSATPAQEAPPETGQRVAAQ